MGLKLLLHCCCAPCSISCIDSLLLQEIDTHLFWYNPNIHPISEHNLRLSCLKDFSNSKNFNLTIREPEDSEDIGFSDKQCERCYRIRLEKAAAFAAKEGFNAFTTTLLISPYQNHDLIIQVCEKASVMYNVDFFYKDFRPLFRESQNTARAQGMYMQKYCGCGIP